MSWFRIVFTSNYIVRNVMTNYYFYSSRTCPCRHYLVTVVCIHSVCYYYRQFAHTRICFGNIYLQSVSRSGQTDREREREKYENLDFKGFLMISGDYYLGYSRGNTRKQNNFVEGKLELLLVVPAVFPSNSLLSLIIDN